MDRVLKLLAALAVLWALWWLGASFAARTAISSWFADQRDRGWQAEFTGISSSGFPRLHKTHLINPALADPQTGVAWRAESLILESPSVKPGQQTMRFPESKQRLSYFDQTYVLSAVGMRADMQVDPTASFQLSNLAFHSDDWSISTAEGRLLSGSGAVLAMAQTDAPQAYKIRFEIPALKLDQSARTMFQISDALPDQFEALSLEANVAFEHPWDMTAITTARPQPRMIKLHLVEMRWGDLEVLAAGRLAIDEDGYPTGTMTLKAENWRDILAVATASGALASELAGPVESTLTALSRLGGNPNALDVKLTFKNGRVSAGVLPLGEAPRIILR